MQRQQPAVLLWWKLVIYLSHSIETNLAITVVIPPLAEAPLLPLFRVRVVLAIVLPTLFRCISVTSTLRQSEGRKCMTQEFCVGTGSRSGHRYPAVPE